MSERIELKVATRPSRLALAQTREALHRLEACYPDLRFRTLTLQTTGDRDQSRSLEEHFPADFFTDALDEAVLSGRADAALHSAKDLPETLHPEFDWCWLPWRADARDALVLSERLAEIPAAPRIGVSSASRRGYSEKRWPKGVCLPIRGNIDKRIRQCDEGKYDVLIMAVAGLDRLGLSQRIHQTLPLEELPTHPAQGALALTFRKDHPQLAKLRSLLMHPVLIVGAGTGKDGHYSQASVSALSRATLCLHDALLDREILSYCSGKKIHVGKRAGEGRSGDKQRHILELVARAAREGERVVRLKGGDPSLFGRLQEEITALSQEKIAFKVYPGIPWLCSAPLQHGILLTERESVRHFHVATGTTSDGEAVDTRQFSKAGAPIYLFMATNKLADLSAGLIRDGYSPATPSAVFRAEPGENNIVRAPLCELAGAWAASGLGAPALVLIGDPSSGAGAFRSEGILEGLRVLVPGTERTRRALLEPLAERGAWVMPLELFELRPNPDLSWIDVLEAADWITFSSGSSVEIFAEQIRRAGFDARRLPKIAVSGPSCAEALAVLGIVPEMMSERHTSESLAEVMVARGVTGEQIVVTMSDASRSPLASRLELAGAEVLRAVTYHNVPIQNIEIPEYDAILFSSPSAVNALWKVDSEGMKKCTLLASIGPVTTAALSKHHLGPHVEARVCDAAHLISALASHVCFQRT